MDDLDKHLAFCLEERLASLFKKRGQSLPAYPPGWTGELGLSLRARRMLLEHEFPSELHSRWRECGLFLGLYGDTEGVVYPLLGFLDQNWRALSAALEEMVLWHFLNYRAFFTIRHTQKGVFHICRSFQEAPSWGRADRAGLVKFFQLLGLLNYQSLEEFARVHGYHGCPDRVQGRCREAPMRRLGRFGLDPGDYRLTRGPMK